MTTKPTKTKSKAKPMTCTPEDIPFDSAPAQFEGCLPTCADYVKILKYIGKKSPTAAGLLKPVLAQAVCDAKEEVAAKEPCPCNDDLLDKNQLLLLLELMQREDR